MKESHFSFQLMMEADVQLTSKRIFLFKSSSENGIDKYAECLTAAGLECCVVPTLTFRFVNQDVLRSNVERLPSYAAIIFTSVRAVQAVESALKGLESSLDLKAITCFVVGETTAQKAKDLGFNPVGQDSGNAQALAQVILTSVLNPGPLLYPCSNIRRDTLSDSLKEKGISLTEIISYETCTNENLETDLTAAIQDLGVPSYAVFFSPSCLDGVMPYVNRNMLPLHNIKAIALGPATEQALLEKGFTPFAVTKKPTPDSLLQILS